MGDKKIGLLTVIGLFAVAGTADLMQFLFDLIPFVGWAASYLFYFIALITLSVWTYLIDVPYVGRTPAAVIEAIPIVNVLPGFTISVLITVLSSNSEWFGKALGFLGLSEIASLAKAPVKEAETATSKGAENARKLAAVREGKTSLPEKNVASPQRGGAPRASTMPVEQGTNPSRFKDIREKPESRASARNANPADSQTGGVPHAAPMSARIDTTTSPRARTGPEQKSAGRNTTSPKEGAAKKDAVDTKERGETSTQKTASDNQKQSPGAVPLRADLPTQNPLEGAQNVDSQLYGHKPVQEDGAPRTSDTPSGVTPVRAGEPQVAQAGGGGVGLQDIQGSGTRPAPQMGSSVKDGLPEIAKEARKNDKEVPYYHLEDKDGKGSWKRGEDLGKSGGSLDPKELGRLRDEVARNGGKCTIAHTHPKALGSGVAIPSIEDAIAAQTLRDQRVNCDMLAVDGKGNVWDVKIDDKNKFVPPANEFIQKRQSLADALNTHPDWKEGGKEYEKVKNMPLELQNDYMFQRALSGEYGAEAQRRATELARDPLMQLNQRYVRELPTMTEEQAKRYIEEYKRFGIGVNKRSQIP